jgi:predicted metal-dependent peptidase
MDEKLTPQQKMKKARTSLILKDPFYGALSMRMRLRPYHTHDVVERSMASMGYPCSTDGQTIAYDPDWIESLDVFQCKGLIAHEVSHVALKHTLRRGERDWKLWNRAGDYIIDPILIEAGFSLPPLSTGEVGHVDPELTGKSIEEAYLILKKREEEAQANCPSGGNQPDSDPAPSDESSNDTDAAGPQQPSQSPKLSDKTSNDDISPQEFGQAMQDFLDGKTQIDIPQGDGESAMLDAPIDMKDNKAIDEADRDITTAVEQAYKVAKSHGNMPKGMERFIEEQNKHVLDWREELRDFLEKSLERDNYNWIPPSRRYIPHGIMMPSLQDSEDIPKIVVLCDTSGSVSNKELKQYAGEMSAILEEFKCNFKVIYWDTDYDGEQEFSYDDMPIKLKAKGGGGTRFAPAFKHIIENKIECEAILYFTDMDAWDWNQVAEVNPNVPVLWLDSYGDIVERIGFKLPFGKHIRIELKQEDD